MVDTSALKQNNNPAEAVPKSSRGWKWKNLLRRIWKDKSQKDIKESLVSELRPIKESLKELPAAPQLQAIAAPPEDEDEEEGVMHVGKIAHKYLSDYAAKQNVDKTFGIYKNPLDKLYYIGNTPIDIRDDNLIVGDEEYEGTPGLWELIISKQPDANVYSRDDFENYAKIMVDTSALKQNNNPAEAVPKSSRGWKWKNLLRRIWKDKSQYEGQGIGTTVVIPSDPDALLDILDILLYIFVFDVSKQSEKLKSSVVGARHIY